MKNRVSRVILVFVILFSIFGPFFVAQTRPAKAFCLFLCADLDVGNLVQAVHDLNQLIDEEIPKLSDVMQKNLKELKDTLNGFVDTIDKTFQKDTKIVAAAINQSMQGVFLQAQDVLRKGYSMMSVLIEQGETAGKQLLDQLALEAKALIDQFKEAAKEIIVAAVGGAVIVIDHATYELYGLISFGLIVVVLMLLLQDLWGLWLKGLRSTGDGGDLNLFVLVPTLGVLTFLLVGPSLVFFSPSVRAWAVSLGSSNSTRQLEAELQLPIPQIFAAIPSSVDQDKVQEVKEVRVIGFNLRPNGYKDPTAQIGRESVPVTRLSDADVVVDISNSRPSAGYQGFILSYQSIVSPTDVITADTSLLIRPPASAQLKPDLAITPEDFKVVPSSPTANTRISALVVVHNIGEGDAGAFAVQWLTDDTSSSGPLQQVDGLGAGRTITVTLQGTYYDAGTFETAVQLDPFQWLSESNKNNNSVKMTVVVQAPAEPTRPVAPPRPTKEPDDKVKCPGKAWQCEREPGDH